MSVFRSTRQATFVAQKPARLNAQAIAGQPLAILFGSGKPAGAVSFLGRSQTTDFALPLPYGLIGPFVS